MRLRDEAEENKAKVTLPSIGSVNKGNLSVEACDLIDDYSFWQQIGRITMPVQAKP